MIVDDVFQASVHLIAVRLVTLRWVWCTTLRRKKKGSTPTVKGWRCDIGISIYIYINRYLMYAHRYCIDLIFVIFLSKDTHCDRLMLGELDPIVAPKQLIDSAYR